MQVTFKVHRYDPEKDGKAAQQTYQVDLPDYATVLDGLIRVREEQDPSLAFRASCLRGSCGECALRVNKKGVLGCTTRVAKAAGIDGVVTVEPIRNIPVIKDLVYDMEAFLWRKVRAVSPWLTPKEPQPEGEYVVAEADMAKVRKTMSCVMCGLCDEGCTVIVVDKDFLGPAALTKAYRVIFDPRDSQHLERLRAISEPSGVWDCTHCFEANGHCPLGIDPTDRIFDMRDEAIRRGVKSGRQNPQVARHYESFAASVKRSGWLDEGRLAVETEGWTNIPGLMKLLPTAARALRRGKAPLPYIHSKRPGAERIRRIFDKAEEQKP